MNWKEKDFNRWIENITSPFELQCHPASLEIVRAELRTTLHSADQLEESLRISTALQSVRAGRMMIEQASLDLVKSLCATLQVPLSSSAESIAEVCLEEGFPLFTGWDLGRSEPCIKIYANVSDAATSVRRRIIDTIYTGALPTWLDTPHIIGLNLTRKTVETKLYVEAKLGQILPFSRSKIASRLEQRAMQLGAAAYTVVSFDLTPSLQARAFFIATRHDAEDAVYRLLEEVPCWNEGCMNLLSFAPRPPSFIGVSLRELQEWTLYFKPHRAQVMAIVPEPLACFRTENVEVGIFVGPSSEADQAYLRTAEHAFSYQRRSGSPEKAMLDVLMQWVASCVDEAETENLPIKNLLMSPPAPWVCIQDDSLWRR